MRDILHVLFIAGVNPRNNSKKNSKNNKKKYIQNINTKFKKETKKIMFKFKFKFKVKINSELKSWSVKSRPDLTLFVLAGGWFNPLARKLRFVLGGQQNIEIKTRKKRPSQSLRAFIFWWTDTRQADRCTTRQPCLYSCLTQEWSKNSVNLEFCFTSCQISPITYKTEDDIPQRNKSEKSQCLFRNKVHAFIITVQFLVFP